jgi:hypothetical protein
LDGCEDNKKQWLKLSENDKFDAWEDETMDEDGSVFEELIVLQ